MCWHLSSVLSNCKFAIKNSYQPVKVNFIHLMFNITLVCSYYHFLLLWFWSLYLLAIFKITVVYLSMYVTPCIMLFGFTCVVINDRLSCFCMTEWFSTVSHFLSCASHIRLSYELLEMGHLEAIVKKIYLFSDIGEAFSFKL